MSVVKKARPVESFTTNAPELTIDGRERYGQVDGEQVDFMCADNDFGRLCGRYGTMSHGTAGKGPWYCRAHFRM